MYHVPMLKLAAWNIRGMNDPLKQKELSTLVRVHSLNVVCILETRVRNHNRVRIFNSILPGWDLHHNCMRHLVGFGCAGTQGLLKLLIFYAMIKLFCVT